MAESVSAHLDRAWSWKYIGRQGVLITQATDAGMRLLAQDPRVAYIEPNLTLYPQTTQSPAPAQLVRINYRTLPSSAQFYPGSYTYNATGSGVVIAIPDSGVYMGGAGIPPDFGIASSGANAGGRVWKIVDCVVTSDCSFVVYAAGDTCQDGICPTNQTRIPPGEYAPGDCSPVDHGTNIAEVAGGAKDGVAKGVTISAAVVTYSCYSGLSRGTVGEMVAGINYFVAQKEASPRTPFVMNISESPESIDSGFDGAVKNALAAGITVVVAAGDTNGSTCGWSPADLAPTTAVISVSSTYSTTDQTMGDATGKCVSLFAPGDPITPFCCYTGTSLSAPIVAGIAATYLQTTPAAPPSEVKAAILYYATARVLPTSGSGSIGAGSPNLLAYSSVSAGAPPGYVPPPPPGLSQKAKAAVSVVITWLLKACGPAC